MLNKNTTKIPANCGYYYYYYFYAEDIASR
jgi:hypothetical protein